MKAMNNLATSDDKVSSQLASADISILALEHPGANDPVYRERRNYITRLAREYREQGGEIPLVEYTPEEIGTWRTAVSKLTELHKKHANRQYLKAKASLGIREDQIPQLRDLNRRLKDYSDFQLVPVEGLLQSKFFLSALEKSVMYCTQYIRHSSKPDYTPEPDIIHEAIGHVPAFTNTGFVEYSKLIGKAAC
ncbi:MAG: phenylalanine 4-monooxygenase, partial [Pyrinomonadaceae bacterium]